MDSQLLHPEVDVCLRPPLPNVARDLHGTHKSTGLPSGSRRTILDIWSHLDPLWGGVGPAAISLSDAVATVSGFSTSWISVCALGETVPPDLASPNGRRFDLSVPRPVADFQLRRLLRPGIEQADICHVHGLWLPHTLAARHLAAAARKPVISSVHGMLEPWELANKRWKKQLYSSLLERNSLAKSSCLRALSRQEAADYRTFGLFNPIAIVPNGISPLERIDTFELTTRFPELYGKKVVLFLGRVHFKKGILNLLECWKTVSNLDPDAHLLIAGGEFEDTGKKARAVVTRQDLQKRVTFAGVLTGNAKLAALSLAHCLCLPSYSEGLSVAVLEALSVGCPVVITPACNVDGVSEVGAGLVTSNDVPLLTESLARMLSVKPHVWQAMSSAAKALARSRYDWRQVGARMDAVYSWLLGGPKPDCVIE